MKFDGDGSRPLTRGPGPAQDPKRSYWLDPAELIQLVRLGPLVSIDLVVADGSGRILVGLRNNEPAKDVWFVPGGRVAKGESLDQAFRRITLQELGFSASRSEARFLGVFEHFYESNFLGEKDVGTHYIVLAHRLEIEDPTRLRFDDQHRETQWLDPEELASAADVHRNTKVYATLS